MPTCWETSKRRNIVSSRPNKRARKSTSEDYTLKTIQREIGSRIPVASDTYDCKINIHLNDLVNRLSFSQYLQKPLSHVAASVIEVGKAYEEQYMRECLVGETACVMGDACECRFIDRERPFVGVCFVIPQVAHADNNMCVLCLRKTTQLLFYRVVTQGLRTNTLIQRYGNICGCDGEYHQSAMLICPPNGPVHCMPLPVVAHQRNQYSVVENHGVKYIKQHGVGMQDFATPPPPLKV